MQVEMLTFSQQAAIICALAESVKFFPTFPTYKTKAAPLDQPERRFYVTKPIYAPIANSGSPLLIASVVTTNNTVPLTGAVIS